MSWVGLRDKMGGHYNAAGLGCAQSEPFDPDAILSVGSLLIEFMSNPRAGLQTVLQFGACHPWASGLVMTLDGQGVLKLEQWQGQTRRTHILNTGILTREQSVLITYTWDAPMRRAVLAVDLGGGAAPIYTELHAPLPLCARDASRIISDPHHCKLHERTMFCAIADEIIPIGALPSLAPQTLIETPTGLRAVGTLRAGDFVTTPSGQQAQVRWCGSMKIPARGRFAPIAMRAPYHGLRTDLTVGPQQRLRMRGPNVEYLFDTDAVSVRVDDLRDGNAVRSVASGILQEYRQVVLDGGAAMCASGLTVEGLNIANIARDPRLRAHSILAQMPAELLPVQTGQSYQVLRGYEAHSLRKLLAA